MDNKELQEDFDPSATDGFQENLAKAFEADNIGTEPIDIVTDDSPSILTITEEGTDKQTEDLPVIDTSFTFEEEVPQEAELDDNVLENISSQLASQVNQECSAAAEKPKKKKISWLFPVVLATATFLALFFFFFFTAAGRKLILHTSFGKYLVSHIGGMVFESETSFHSALKLPGPLFIELPAPAQEDISNESILPFPSLEPAPLPDEDEEQNEDSQDETIQEPVHILLLGMDENEDGISQTDLILIASLDVQRDEIKLTTVLRNLLVQAPGRADDRLCSIYSTGGISAVYDGLENVLGIRPNGYILFTYSGFKQVIDALGGVSMVITAKEADYLNRTNYIALPENRNLFIGMNHLNGDQALGYCRIRHVGTAQNEYNDIGRTARCRRLATAVFEQCRNKGALELYEAAKLCLSYLITDITGEECTKYLELLMEMKEFRISDFRIPSEGTYQTSIIRGSSALIADIAQNRALWQEFLFPEEQNKQPDQEE